jgi:hypothetical protein
MTGEILSKMADLRAVHNRERPTIAERSANVKRHFRTHGKQMRPPIRRQVPSRLGQTPENIGYSLRRGANMRQNDDRPEEHSATNVLIRSKPNSRMVSSNLIMPCSLLQGEAKFFGTEVFSSVHFADETLSSGWNSRGGGCRVEFQNVPVCGL